MIIRRLANSFALVCAAIAYDACAGESALSFMSAGSPTEITASVQKPDGAGPFPAVIIMHDCSGLGPRSSGAPARWAKHLLADGYAVMMPDSFTARGLPDGVCTAARNLAIAANVYVRSGDAYAALAALRALPYIDGKRIGIMGGSHGGSTTLAAMVAASDSYAPPDGFIAAIALYPSCSARYGTWSTVQQYGSYGPVTGYAGVYHPLAPLLILTGELDDWTPAEPCRELVERGRAAGYPLDIRVYARAHHSFDSDRPVRYIAARNNNSSANRYGATTGGNAEAWADARQRVNEFFAANLKTKQ